MTQPSRAVVPLDGCQQKRHCQVVTVALAIAEAAPVAHLGTDDDPGTTFADLFKKVRRYDPTWEGQLNLPASAVEFICPGCSGNVCGLVRAENRGDLGHCGAGSGGRLLQLHWQAVDPQRTGEPTSSQCYTLASTCCFAVPDTFLPCILGFAAYICMP